MAFDPYKEIDSKKIAQLQFKWELCNYIYFSKNKGLSVGQLYKVDNIVYEKIKKILTGNSTHNIKTGDKVYVLPGHNLAHTRIKEYLKNNDANTTKNIENATVIAGTDNFHEDNCNYTQVKLASIMFNYNPIYEFTNNEIDVIDTIDTSFNEYHPDYFKLKNQYKQSKITFMSPDAYNYINYNSNIHFAYGNTYFLTPQCMEIVYHVLSGKLRVLNDETISQSANSGMKLEDSKSYDTINTMLASPNEKDKEMGVELLIHADLSGNIDYHVWKLSKAHYYIISGFDRSKALSFFLDYTKFAYFGNLNSEEFIKYADTKGILTKSIMQDLIDDIFIENINACHYFNENYFALEKDNETFQWTIKLKPKWMNILKPETDGY